MAGSGGGGGGGNTSMSQYEATSAMINPNQTRGGVNPPPLDVSEDFFFSRSNFFLLSLAQLLMLFS